MRDEIKQTDAEIVARFHKQWGIDFILDDLVFTRDALDDFENLLYFEREFFDTADGEPATVARFYDPHHYTETRLDVLVVDFGSVRVVGRAYAEDSEGAAVAK